MFASIEQLAPDAILGLTRAFREDPRDEKIDLGVGVYRTPDGRTPVMRAVAKAEQIIVDTHDSKAYTPPEGAPGFADGVMKLVFGAEHDIITSGRAVGVHAPGGCGALRLAGEIVARAGAKAITIGAPTWANHHPLLSAAGNTINMVPYYDTENSTLDFDGFVSAIEKLGPKDVLLLHGGCHNPTGQDLSREQIDQIAELAKEKGFTPIIDTAYHGFAQDLDSDAYMMRRFAETLPELLITYSCSKNFGLYRERTGVLIIIGETPDHANAVRSHATSIARTMYSMPPAHGGAIVAEILGSPELEGIWRDELAQMTAEVRGNRKTLVDAAASQGLGNRLAYIEAQNGMFSMLPLSTEGVAAMRDKHGIYIVGGGRINMCGVNTSNVDHLVRAFKDVSGL